MVDQADLGYDEFRRRIDKLTANPDKLVQLPELRGPKAPTIREFNREVGGSVAGAGSGDFHTYRALRRKEAARQNFILHQARKDEADDQFQREMAEIRAKEDEKTSKNRLKRLKQKQKSAKKVEAVVATTADKATATNTEGPSASFVPEGPSASFVPEPKDNSQGTDEE